MPTKQSNLSLADTLKLLAVMPATGAGIGGLIGAARAEKGKRLRTALGDAGVGGMAGLGFALGGTAGGAAGMALGGKSREATENASASMGGAGAALGAVGAGVLGQKLRKEMEDEYDNSVNNSLGTMTKINKDLTMKKTTKQSAAEDEIRIPMHWPQDDSADKVPLGTSTAVGAGLGGLIGALRAPKGKMLKYTLGGAGIGGLTGLGGGVGYNLLNYPAAGTPAGDTNGAGILRAARLPMAVGGGALAGHLGNKLYDEVESYIPEKKEKKEDVENSKKKKTEKKSSALSFGEKCAAGVDWKSIMHTGLGGAALGAGLGGLAGMVAPGEDANGKRRGRLSGALRGALGGGLVGGGAGAIGEAASPGFGRSAYNYANDLYRQLFGRPQQKRVLEPLVNEGGEMQTPEEYRRMLNNNLFYNETGHVNTPNELSGNYLPHYGVPGGRVGPPVR